MVRILGKVFFYVTPSIKVNAMWIAYLLRFAFEQNLTTIGTSSSFILYSENNLHKFRHTLSTKSLDCIASLLYTEMMQRSLSVLYSTAVCSFQTVSRLYCFTDRSANLDGRHVVIGQWNETKHSVQSSWHSRRRNGAVGDIARWLNELF